MEVRELEAESCSEGWWVSPQLFRDVVGLCEVQLAHPWMPASLPWPASGGRLSWYQMTKQD